MTVPEIPAHVQPSGRETTLEASLETGDSGGDVYFFIYCVKIKLINSSVSSVPMLTGSTI